MKRILAVLLCALTLVGLVPFSAEPAQAVTYASVTTSDLSVYVGETIYWYVDEVYGSGSYYYSFDIYKDNVLYSYQNYSSTSYRFFTPSSPGKYKVKVWVYDLVYDNQINWFSDVTNVYARPVNKVTKVEATSATSLKITWNKMPGATQYELWRSTNKNTGWVLAKATTSNTFSNTYLKTGTQYFYKVRYYTPDEGWSAFSPAAAGVPMSKSGITSISSPKKGQVKLVWPKAPGATGYQVLMATKSNGTYKSVRTLTGTTVTFTGLKSGSTYYFKVRPYRKVYTIVNWGAYSAPRGIKVK